MWNIHGGDYDAAIFMKMGWRHSKACCWNKYMIFQWNPAEDWKVIDGDEDFEVIFWSNLKYDSKKMKTILLHKIYKIEMLVKRQKNQ